MNKPIGVAVFQCEQGRSDTEVELFQVIIRIVQLQVLLQCLPPAGSPSCLYRKGSDLIDGSAVDGHATDMIQQDI